ncbi:four-carbon acid sugar kinase family protein [Deinococcus sonorensis]|uniref:Four-carbon acid sugar kinase family protein n=2 Tax=Deinococcus sonorensis TaxID=309891 RepID=A0AAU7UGD7_9DEIO
MTPRLGVVADDITGAGDIGALLAKHGYAVRIVSQQADWEALADRFRHERTDVLIIDTDSRFLPPDEAAGRVVRATRALQQAGGQAYWKKTCSVFRGNVGAEFDAMLGTLGVDFGVAVAAFPRNGRSTRHGDHFVWGVALPDSEFGQDPVHPRREVNLILDLGQQTARPVAGLALETVRQGPEAVRAERMAQERSGTGYLLADAETQEDLRVLAGALSGETVFLGSSGLAEELPAFWPAPAPFRPLEGASWAQPERVLMIAASVMPQSRAQVQHYQDHGGTVHQLNVDLALQDPEQAIRELAALAQASIEEHGTVLLRSPNTPEQVQQTRAAGQQLGLDALQVSQRVSSVLAGAAERAARQTGTQKLVALGGDTSAALTRAFGITHTVVVQELAPGLPSSYAPDQGLLVILKSGSFGPPDFLELAIRHLRQPEAPL